jgi:phosphoserine phosphatase RsbU/P
MSTGAKPGQDFAMRKDPTPASIPRIRGADLAAVYYGQRRSGDFYDCVRINHECVLFGLFDVAGGFQDTRHIVVALQETFRSSGSQILEPRDANALESMLELWIRLNRAVMKAAGGVHSCPAFLGCYNEEVMTLSYVNAGHSPGICRGDTDLRMLDATALPLGLFSHSIPDSSIVFLRPGNGILLVSKGILEARRRSEEFGIERVTEYFRESGPQSAHETCVGVLSQVRQFMGTAPTHNDVTALSLMRATQATG